MTKVTGAAVPAASAEYSDVPQLIGAIDQGTSSTRFLVFEQGTGQLIASSQVEIKRLTPREGWVEIDPNAIMSSVYATMANVHEQLDAKHLTRPRLLNCIGICNQRESAVVWDSTTGQPLYNVIVWMDNRTKDIVDDMIDSIPGRDFNRLKDKTGLPMSTYFSAFKLKWLLDNVLEVRRALSDKRLLVGTVDSWILWNLTGEHLTDVTNASRTFLMDIETLQWDKSLCKHFRVPMEILPKIRASADQFGQIKFGPFAGAPITGVIGDQSAALFGHNCLRMGQTKATFGTGCFIMQNIGPGPLSSALSGVQREAKQGLITTVAFKLKDKPVCYALEGSIKIAGAALTWLRDNMQLIENYEECDQLVNMTTNSAGVFFVPALGGLYSPYWDPNAAGLFIGLSQFSRREHLVRATFDSIAFQTNDILSLTRGVTNGLMIDGGLCKSDNLCQILADITGCDIVRPSMCETSALGAAMIAGCGAGIWDYESMLAHSNTPYEYSSSSNQHNRYPPESLHHDSKFSTTAPLQMQQATSSGQHMAQASQALKRNAQAKCGKATSDALQVSASASTMPQLNQNKPLQTSIVAAPASTAHNQRHRSLHNLRHRDCERIMRSLNDGGGVNDDAGGGQVVRHGLDHDDKADDDNYEREDDCDERNTDASSGALLASCSDADNAITSSGEFSLTDKSDEGVAVIGSAVAKQHINRSLLTASDSATNEFTMLPQTNNVPANQSDRCAGSKSPSSSIMSGLMHLNQHHISHVAAASSGYNSGDNFESATNNSANSCQLLTESIRCRLAADSPTSQVTDLMSSLSNSNGHESVSATPTMARPFCSSDLTPPASAVAASSTTCLATLGSSARNSQHLAPDNQVDESFQYSYHSAFTNATSMVGAEPVIEGLQDKLMANAEHVADEVHEFGGRDSYGEDGYDSSTVSFDSYSDEASAGRRSVVDGYADDDDENDREVARLNSCNVDGKSAGAIRQTTERIIDDIDNKRESLIEGTKQLDNNEQLVANVNHHHHRRRQASLLDKHMDVFQPYISLEHRGNLVNTWRLAVSRSMQWTKVHHEEIRRIDYQRLSSLPISMYVFFSVGMLALSVFLSSNHSVMST